MAKRLVILLAPIPQLRDEGSEARMRSAVILSEAKDPLLTSTFLHFNTSSFLR